MRHAECPLRSIWLVSCRYAFCTYVMQGAAVLFYDNISRHSILCFMTDDAWMNDVP